MSGQEGIVEPGRPPVVAMDLDRALRVLRALVQVEDSGVEGDALAALQALVDRARQYVVGPTSGRFEALCQVLQEPAPIHRSSVSAETVAQAYLTERGMVAVHRDVLERLGIALPSTVGRR